MSHAHPTIIPIRDAANASRIDLTSYIFTHHLRRARRITMALEARMVGHRTGLISPKFAPFGGVKQSGLDREGSRRGLDEHLETKYVNIHGV